VQGDGGGGGTPRAGSPNADPKAEVRRGSALDKLAAAPPASEAPNDGQAQKGKFELPSRKTVCRVLKAFKLTGIYIFLCIMLGEIENGQFDSCGFGTGWTCFSPYSCETWKNGEWPSDAGKSNVDRAFCWSWIDQLYYAVVTYVTIGYGDVTAHTKGGKLLSAFLVAFGVFCFTTLLAELGEFKHSQRLGADKTLKQRLAELKEVIAQDDDGTVSPEEYIIFNLKKMGKVDEETLLLLRDQFTALDADGSGALDNDDLDILMDACEESDD